MTFSMVNVLPDEIEGRACLRCTVWKPLTCFCVYKTGQVRSYCKPCSYQIHLYKRATDEAFRQRTIEAAKDWNRNNPEKLKECVKTWRRKNPEKVKLSVFQWQQANPEKVREFGRIKDHRRRVRKLNTPAHEQYTIEDKQQVFDYYGNCCVYCSDTEDLQVEHLQPLSRGGLNTRDNIAPACPTCNYSKGAKTVAEFAEYTGKDFSYLLPQPEPVAA